MQPARSKVIDKDISDLDIARRIAARDHDAFELLICRYNQGLYRTARSILRDDTEDVLQDAYLLIYRGISNSRGAVADNGRYSFSMQTTVPATSLCSCS